MEDGPRRCLSPTFTSHVSFSIGWKRCSNPLYGSSHAWYACYNVAFAVLGFLSPSSRGSLVTMSLVFYILFSTVSGYVSGYVYKQLQGEQWRRNVLLTAFLIPGVIFAIFLVLNFVLIYRESSSAMPFGTLFALFCMWFLVSIPLCVLGAYFGFKRPVLEAPCKTNQIPRQIPAQPLYLNGLFSALLGGILPFAAIYIELYFILSSIWSHRIYYMFGFLFFIFVILIATSALISVLFVYFKLCAEDYQWAWKGFNAAAASGLYVFIYSAFYYSRHLCIVSLNQMARMLRLQQFSLRGRWYFLFSLLHLQELSDSYHLLSLCASFIKQSRSINKAVLKLVIKFSLRRFLLHDKSSIPDPFSHFQLWT